MLQSLLAPAGTAAPRILYSEHFHDGAALFSHASALNLEGVVSKRADAPYRWGRGEQWVKLKCRQQARFAVVGFVPEGSHGLLKLRLARRHGDAPVYVGRVGAGWDRATARDIRKALAPLARRTSPPTKPIKKADTTWIEPRLDADVSYAEFTDDGFIRHPVFKTLFAPTACDRH